MLRYVGSFTRISALVIAALSLIACQKGGNQVGLPDASASFAGITTEYPGVVMVSIPGGGICTGTFISKKAVLTAAHCAQAAGRYSVVSSFGTFYTFTKRVMSAGEVADPNDIAVLVFDSEVANDSQIHAIASHVSAGDTARLVGFGCNNISTRRGAGVKRTGTNVVASVSDYVEFRTPVSSSTGGGRGILGPENRAGSCFGDSGGPAFVDEGGVLKVAAVTHAGGVSGSDIISQYVDVSNRSDNRSFLRTANTDYSLGISGL